MLLLTQLARKQEEEEKARVRKATPYPYTTDYPVVRIILVKESLQNMTGTNKVSDVCTGLLVCNSVYPVVRTILVQSL